MWAHLQNVMLILLPLFVGFALKLPKPALIALDKLLFLLVYLLLLLIGMELAQVEHLGKELGKVILYSILLFLLLMFCTCNGSGMV